MINEFLKLFMCFDTYVHILQHGAGIGKLA